MSLLDFLPSGHNTSASAYRNSVPGLVKVGVGYRAHKFGVAGKGDEVVAVEFVIVVCHCVDEATDNSFRDICLDRISILRITQSRK